MLPVIVWRRYKTGMAGSPITVRCALLQALLAGEDCGSAIMQRLERMTGGRVRFGSSVLYPALWALESEGLVTRRHVPRGAGGGRGRAPQVYTLTEAGRAHGVAERAALLALFTGGQG